MDLPGLDDFVKTVMPEYQAQLRVLVSIPSISAQSKYNPQAQRDSQGNIEGEDHTKDVERIVPTVAAMAQEWGFTATVLLADHAPALVARLEVDPHAPWVMIYNHLDVQPVKAEEWNSPPFAPTPSDREIVGRGATDDKGPMLAVLYALRYLHQTQQLPVNVELVYETAEEIGSPGFERILRKGLDRGLLNIPYLNIPDSILVSDTIFEGDDPAISYSLRGILKMNISLKLHDKVIHSGIGGGVAVNPVNVLVQALARCYDANGQPTFPGWDEGLVESKNAWEREKFAEHYDLKRLLSDLGAGRVYTSNPSVALERLWHKPTFEIHALPGPSGTMIPPKAEALVTMRLCKNQEPEKIRQNLERYLQQEFDGEIKVAGGGMPAVETPLNNPFVEHAAAAYEFGFGRKPVYVGSGGTIGSFPPMQALFPSAPIVCMALSKVSDGYHAPNEKFEWGQAELGIKTMAHYLASIGDVRTTKKI